MPVTETAQAVGAWSITLSPDTPRTIIDALQYFQHIVIATGRQDPRVAKNSLFSSGRYTGVITGLDFQSLSQGQGPVISGDGLATWLGTPNGVGPVIENSTIYTSAAISTVVNALRPAAVGAGTNYSIAGSGTYSGTFVWKTPRDALTSLAQQVSTGPLPTQTVEWRVNNNCTLDFGPVSSLYKTTPVVAIVAKNSGVDMSVRALPGVAELIEDVKDYTTRVVVLASGSGTSTAVGAANDADVGATNPYTDFFGNPVQMTRMVSASSVSSFNATAAAQSALIPYTVPANQIRLSSQEYDIKGEVQVGDYVWLYDPDAGLVDFSNEVIFRGQRINPTKQRVIELTWPVVQGMSVAYRDKSGNWYDLTDYVMFESGDTTVYVGGYNRNLVPTSEPVGPRPQPDTTIPNTPVFGAFSTTTYLGTSDGKTKAQIQVTWATPTNTDGTTLVDGDHYEIQYRPDIGYFAKNPSYNQLNSTGYTYNSLAALGGTYNALIPQATLDWKVTFVAFGVNNVLIQELTPGVNYDFQIRCSDTATPPNNSAWSATTTFQAATDTIPPQTPDAPTVAANLASVQVTWDCGSATGGTFNQAADLHHIEVHGSYDPLFMPSSATKLGNVIANIGNITGKIPVVASFTIPPGQPPAQNMYIKIIAVDITGNPSQPSAAAGATAILWSNAYITDLSVSKLTAGTITASMIMGGTLTTALTGVRAGMDNTGLWCYDAAGDRTFFADASTGNVTLASRGAGQRVTLQTTFDLTPYGAPRSADALVMYTDAVSPPAVFAAYVGTSAAGIIEVASAYASLSSAAGPWGSAATISPIVSLVTGQGGSLGIYDTVSGNTDGGLVQVQPQLAFFGAANEGSVASGILYFLNTGASSSEMQLEITGYQQNYGAVSPGAVDTIFSGDVGGIAAGNNSLVWSYGTTLTRNTIVVATSLFINAGVQASKIGSLPSTTGFTLTLGGNYSSLWSVNFIVFGYR